MINHYELDASDIKIYSTDLTRKELIDALDRTLNEATVTKTGSFKLKGIKTDVQAVS